jgi:drug/metabolite transporter (DMT)-like permease
VRDALGSALLILSAIAFAFMGLFRDWAARDGLATPMLLGLRFALAAVVLGAVGAGRPGRWPRGRTLALLVAMGAIGYVGEAGTYFAALSFAPVGLVSLLLYLYPAIVTVLARVLFREPIGPARGVALALALAGSAFTILPALAGASGVRPLGVLLGLACAFIYAGYILAGSRVPARVDPVKQAAIVTASCAVVFLTLAMARGDALPQTPRAWGAVVWLALLCSVFAMTAFLAGLAMVGPVRASILSVVEPVATVAVGALLLGDRLAWAQFLGGALILAAALIAALAKPPPSRAVG